MSGWLARRPVIAGCIIGIAALAQAVHAHTPSEEWGGDWFLRRAEFYDSGLRAELLQRHPRVHPHSRIYFAAVPTGTGIGQSWFSPAVRMWYDDPTLEAGFVRDCQPRSVERQGEDYFFRFDNRTNAWVETVKGPENVERDRRGNPGWETDHGALAILLGRAGDWRGAAVETQKLLSAAPTNPQYAFNMAVILGNLGDTLGMKRYAVRADSLRTAISYDGP